MNSTSRRSRDLLFLLILTAVGGIFAIYLIAKAEKTYSYISSLSDESLNVLAERNESYSQPKTKK